MTRQAVEIATEDDRASVTAALVTAFARDPFLRWLFPDPGTYLQAAPRVFQYFAGGAFARKSAYRTQDRTGAALWLPPGVSPDEEGLGMVLQTNIGAKRLDTVFAVMEEVGAGHPDEPHWYLPAIGVDPMAQGKGFGSALLAESLNVCTQTCTPAYLESTNPANIPLYLRHGFEVVGEIQVGGSPVLTRMLRHT